MPPVTPSTPAKARRAAPPIDVPSDLPIDLGSPVPSPVSTEEIAARAFELFCARGGEDGHDLEDWLEAERQLSSDGRETSME